MTRVTPAQLERWLDEAEEALENGNPDVAQSACERVLAHDAAHVDALFLLAEAHREQGDVESAEKAYRTLVDLHQDHAQGWAALAGCLFDQCEIDEAHRAVSRSLRLVPDLPEAAWIRALVRERRGNDAGAQRDYRRANRVDPQAFPLPVPLDDATIEAVVEDVLRTLHPTVRTYLRKVAIMVEEFPEDEVCASFHPPAWPAELLGYFTGQSMQDREMGLPWSNLPSAIVLYRKNLERIASDRERLVEELRVTVFHEVGHFLGLDEDDLEARGLD